MATDRSASPFPRPLSSSRAAAKSPTAAAAASGLRELPPLARGRRASAPAATAVAQAAREVASAASTPAAKHHHPRRTALAVGGRGSTAHSPPVQPRRTRCAQPRGSPLLYDLSTDADRGRAATRIAALVRGWLARRRHRVVCRVVPVGEEASPSGAPARPHSRVATLPIITARGGVGRPSPATSRGPSDSGLPVGCGGAHHAEHRPPDHTPVLLPVCSPCAPAVIAHPHPSSPPQCADPQQQQQPGPTPRALHHLAPLAAAPSPPMPAAVSVVPGHFVALAPLPPVEGEAGSAPAEATDSSAGAANAEFSGLSPAAFAALLSFVRGKPRKGDRRSPSPAAPASGPE